MKLPNKLLQIAYYGALNGNVSYNGSNVPVFDVVPPTQDYPYIVLGSQSIVHEGTRNSFGVQSIMDVDIVTGFEGSYGGKSQVYDIADDVVQLIATRASSYFSLSGFSCYVSELESSTILEEITETHILFVNKLRFRHLIQEL